MIYDLYDILYQSYIITWGKLGKIKLLLKTAGSSVFGWSIPCFENFRTPKCPTLSIFLIITGMVEARSQTISTPDRRSPDTESSLQTRNCGEKMIEGESSHS